MKIKYTYMIYNTSYTDEDIFSIDDVTIDSLYAALEELLSNEESATYNRVNSIEKTEYQIIIYPIGNVTKVEITEEDIQVVVSEEEYSAVIDGINIGKENNQFVSKTINGKILVEDIKVAQMNPEESLGVEFAPVGETCIVNTSKKEYPQIVFRRDDSYIGEEDLIEALDERGNVEKILPMNTETDLNFIVLFEGSRHLYLFTKPAELPTSVTRITDTPLFTSKIIDITGTYRNGAVTSLYAISYEEDSGVYIVKRIDYTADTFTLSNKSARLRFKEAHPGSKLVSITATANRLFFGFAVKTGYGVEQVAGFKGMNDDREGEYLKYNNDLLFSMRHALLRHAQREEEESYQLTLGDDKLTLSDDEKSYIYKTHYTCSKLPFNPLGYSKVDQLWKWDSSNQKFKKIKAVAGKGQYVQHSYFDEEGNELLTELMEKTALEIKSKEFLYLSADLGGYQGVGMARRDDNYSDKDYLKDLEDFRLYNSGQLLPFDYERDIVGYYVFTELIRKEEHRAAVIPFNNTSGSSSNKAVFVLGSDGYSTANVYSGLGRMVFHSSFTSVSDNLGVRTRSYNKPSLDNSKPVQDLLLLWNGDLPDDLEDKVTLNIEDFSGQSAVDEDITIDGISQKRFVRTTADGLGAIPLISQDKITINRHALKVRVGGILKTFSGAVGGVEYLMLIESLFSDGDSLFTVFNQVYDTDTDYPGIPFTTFNLNSYVLIPSDRIKEVYTRNIVFSHVESETPYYLANNEKNIVRLKGSTDIEEANTDNFTKLAPVVQLISFVNLVIADTDIFEENSVYRYKTSFLYDGHQEGPMSITYLPVLINQANCVGVTIGLVLDSIREAAMTDRITHICVYCSKEEGGQEGELYRLVKQIPLDKEKFYYYDNAFRYEFIDDGTRLGTFEAINGYSETLKSVSIKRECQAVCSNYLFVGNCEVPQESSKSYRNMILRSKLGKYSIFNYIEDFLMIPFEPIKMAAYRNKLYVFSNDAFCIVDPERLAIEFESRQLGVNNKRHVLETEEALYVFSKGKLYSFEGDNIKELSTPVEQIEGDFKGLLPSEVSQVAFSKERRSIVVFGAPGNGSEENTIRAYMLHLTSGAWGIVNVTSAGQLVSAYNNKDEQLVVVTSDGEKEYISAIMFEGENLLGASLIYGLPETPLGKTYLYKVISDNSVTTTIDNMQYDNTKMKFSGGKVKFSFSEIVKNISLMIRRRLPYAKDQP